MIIAFQMKHKLTLFFFFLSILLFSTPSIAKTVKKGFVPAPPPPSGYALIYLYRPNTPPYWVRPKVIVDSETLLKLPNKGYSWFYAKAGDHIIKTKWGAMSSVPQLEFLLKVAPQQTYYLRLKGSITQGGSFSNVYTGIDAVSESLALKELKKIKKYWPAKTSQVD